MTSRTLLAIVVICLFPSIALAGGPTGSRRTAVVVAGATTGMAAEMARR